MKSCFTLAFVLLVCLTVVGGGGLLWYLSHTTEFSRKDTHTSALPPSRPTPPPTPPPAVRPQVQPPVPPAARTAVPPVPAPAPLRR
ncbi:MAG: hypothetical protein NTW21_06170 [Verrucomicrobia bacterium]|nr:hypothetical protein [Verrucomicrobiota bacterium]